MGGHASPEAVVGVIVTFTVLATACCGLRLYARQLLIRGGGWDDFFICAATVGQAQIMANETNADSSLVSLHLPHSHHLLARYVVWRHDHWYATYMAHADT